METRQLKTVSDILESKGDRHIECNGLRIAIEQSRRHADALIKLDHRSYVRHIGSKCRVEGLVGDRPRENTSAPRDRPPFILG